jgi:uncharacterized protein YbcI
MKLEEKVIKHLQQNFLLAWQEAHGVKSGKASALIGPDHLAMLIDNAFSRAERTMAGEKPGKALLRQYALELLNQICNEISLEIEETAGCKIRSRDVNVNLDENQVMVIFSFESSDET